MSDHRNYIILLMLAVLIRFVHRFLVSIIFHVKHHPQSAELDKVELHWFSLHDVDEKTLNSFNFVTTTQCDFR